ncbi:MAG: UvrB/UvrC motif-containing protein [Patescibacteria group bacterium]
MLGGDEKPGDIKDVLKIELMAEPGEIQEVIKDKTDEMEKAAVNLMFETAAILRDEIVELEKELKKMRKKNPAKSNPAPSEKT